MENPLTGAIVRLRDAALAQLEIQQSFGLIGILPKDVLRGFQDTQRRNLAQAFANLIRLCHAITEPGSDKALDCYASVSRQPHFSTHSHGRSATEFVLALSMAEVRLASNFFRANLLRPEGLTDEEMKGMDVAVPIMLEASKNSGSLLAYNRCQQLRAEIGWEAAKALDYATQLVPTSAEQPSSEPPLGERRQDALDALYDLKAFAPDSRATTAGIAERLDVDPAALKEPVAELVGRGLAESKKGRGGGVWLTQAGRDLVERQRKR